MIDRPLTDFSLLSRPLNKELDCLPELPTIGTLHRALLFKSGAELAWKQKDKEAWKSYITEAVNLMTQGGLIHQLALVKRTYGSALNSSLSECHLDLD